MVFRADMLRLLCGAYSFGKFGLHWGNINLNTQNEE